VVVACITIKGLIDQPAVELVLDFMECSKIPSTGNVAEKIAYLEYVFESFQN
jgi:hypothetical protein